LTMRARLVSNKKKRTCITYHGHILSLLLALPHRIERLFCVLAAQRAVQPERPPQSQRLSRALSPDFCTFLALYGFSARTPIAVCCLLKIPDLTFHLPQTGTAMERSRLRLKVPAWGARLAVRPGPCEPRCLAASSYI